MSQVNACFDRLENNVAAGFDERQRTCLHEVPVESAQALEAQRELLSRILKSQLKEKDLNRLGIIFRGV